MSQNVLVSRPDRLGDVILSTPTLTAIRNSYPNSKITFLVRKPMLDVLRGHPAIDDFLVYDPEGEHQGLSGLFRLIDQIREREIRFGVALQNHWKIAAALYGAGVRYRVGPWGPPYSFLFYNRGVRQRRSRVEMHEADYNLQLLRKIGVRPFQERPETSLTIPKTTVTWADRWIQDSGLKGNWVAVHPGMGGSALNWPEAHYVGLVESLLNQGTSVLLTAGPAEKDLVERVASEALKRLQNQSPAKGAQLVSYVSTPNLGVDHLGALLSRATVVVAPSTGPLHLAVALGRPVVTFFPPVRVQSALRWGPYLPQESAGSLDSRASVLVPEIYCGQDFKCLGSVCRYFPCMQGLTIEAAVSEVRRHLNSSHSKE
jgi:heptosyltransferase-3